jgi:hypothetical protein
VAHAALVAPAPSSTEISTGPKQVPESVQSCTSTRLQQYQGRLDRGQKADHK